MKRFYCTLFITSLFSIIYTGNVSAQINVEQSFFTGKGQSLSKLISGTTGKAERIFLYNVGKDMFLNAGGFWGTRTTTFTVGLPITFEKQSNGAYTMSGPFYNKETGSFIGRVDYDTSENAYRRNGVFYDRGKEPRDGIYWTFEEASNNGEDMIYYIKCEKKYNTSIKEDYYLVSNQEMTIQVFKGGNNNLVKCLNQKDKAKNDDSYAQWKVVTEDEMIALFNTTYDKENPSDATFLLKAQNFNRMNQYNNDDNTTDKEADGWKKSGNFSYECGTDITLSSGQNQDDHGAGKYGMFYCGGIKKAKKRRQAIPNNQYQTKRLVQSGLPRFLLQLTKWR